MFLKYCGAVKKMLRECYKNISLVSKDKKYCLKNVKHYMLMVKFRKKALYMV